MVRCEIESPQNNLPNRHRFIKRTTIVARLFYHTAMCLLAQTNPAMSSHYQEMHDMQLSHSHQLCGIVAHLKDR